MVPQVNITPRAKADLENIWNYSFDIWGEAQADKYVHALYQRFLWLAEQPQTGKLRSDIAPDYRSFSQGQHVVFYISVNGGIAIIGIPHKKMDILNYFD
jgi:toxin ParE1/3/4